jgi:hypothetical protein
MFDLFIVPEPSSSKDDITVVKLGIGQIAAE